MNHATMNRQGFVPYGPSRAGAEALSRIMAADLAGTAVRVNLLLPGGATRTGMLPEEELTPELRGRLIDPAVMGPPIRWLASPAAAAVHDERLMATGSTPGWPRGTADAPVLPVGSAYPSCPAPGPSMAPAAEGRHRPVHRGRRLQQARPRGALRDRRRRRLGAGDRLAAGDHRGTARDRPGRAGPGGHRVLAPGGVRRRRCHGLRDDPGAGRAVRPRPSPVHRVGPARADRPAIALGPVYVAAHRPTNVLAGALLGLLWLLVVRRLVLPAPTEVRRTSAAAGPS